MKTAIFSAVLLVAMAFIAAPGGATVACNGNVTTITAGTETMYIDDRAPSPNDPPLWGFFVEGEGTWVYLESNGIDGYQSGGSNSFGVDDNPVLITTDDCANGSNPDTLVF